MKSFRTAAARTSGVLAAVAVVALTSGAAFAGTTPAPSTAMTARPAATASATTPAPSARAPRAHRRGHQVQAQTSVQAPATAKKK
ncbi:hypothetical protein [Brevundimonas diminuta]|uniref:hypothetical protein n=1 Tax=Brevundimonas diminuta TaxID=293 RepID=UPI001F58A964|nr:hypothetical protein [Brevundimonas diminuta]